MEHSALTGCFREEFADMSEDHFKLSSEGLWRRFHDYLRTHGLYIPKSINVHIYPALSQAVNKELWCLTHEVHHVENAHVIEAIQIFKDSAESRPDSKIHYNSNNHIASHYPNTSHLFKAYSDNNDWYTGVPTDDFDQKFSLFIEHCEQAEIDHDDDRRKALSIMLAGDARKYYFQTLKNMFWIWSLLW